MTYLLIILLILSILVIIVILSGLLLNIPGSEIKKEGIASAVCILVFLLVHFIYDIAAVSKSVNIKFYVAFIGGGVTLLIYNTIRNRKSKTEQ
jgi:hypothetical protein